MSQSAAPPPPEPSLGAAPRPVRYWARRTWPRGEAGPPGQDLAQLRRGLGRPAGSVPEMWVFYTELTGAGEVSPRLRAEHIALSLFGLHQQSRQTLMHQPGVGVGAAAAALRRSGRYSPEAVERRLTAAASTATVDGLAMHLRGLVQQLSAAQQALDYDRLFQDLLGWQTSAGAARVRRRWGGDFYAPDRTSSPPTPPPDSEL